MQFELPPVLASAPGMRAAELMIDGLAVLCFNDTTGDFWEVAYPRRLQHTLTIKIQSLDAHDRPIDQPLYREVDRKVRSFNISLTDGSERHFGQFPRGGPRATQFDRKPTRNDPHDLRWMIDLAGDELGHGHFLGL